VLGDLGEEAQVLAGGTWIMRAPIRGEYSDKVFVSLANIVGLHSIEIDTKQAQRRGNGDTSSVGRNA
jgi:carbon-monoxide dehydrogenase medium subunit